MDKHKSDQSRHDEGDQQHQQRSQHSHTQQQSSDWTPDRKNERGVRSDVDADPDGDRVGR